MSLRSKVALNAATQTAGKVLATVLGLFTVAIMTRHLGAEGYGEFTTVLSFLQFVAIFAGFGIPITAAKMLSRPGTDERRLMSNVFAMRIVSGLVLFGAAPLVALLFPYPGAIKTGIAIGTLSFMCITMNEVMVGIFQKHLTTWKTALAEVIGRAVLFAGVLAAALMGGGLITFVLVLSVSNLVQFAIAWAFARGHVRFSLAFDWDVWREVWRESWPVGVSIMFNLLYLKGDIIILSVMRTQTEVGIYGAAYKVLDVITAFPFIFMGLALPLLTHAWVSNDLGAFKRRMSLSFDLLTMCAVPLMFGAFAVSGDLMALVAGDEFRASGPLLAWLMVGAFAVYWHAIFNHAIVAVGRQRSMVAIYAADALVSVALYLVLIPRYGGLGAAWVTVFSEMIIAIAATVLAYRVTRFAPKLGQFAKVLVAAVVMYAALRIAAHVHVLPRILYGVFVFVLALYALGGLKKELVRSVFLKETSRTS